MARADRKTLATAGAANSPSAAPAVADPIAAVRADAASKRAEALNPDAPTVERIADAIETAIVELESQLSLLSFEVERQRIVEAGRAKREAHELRERQERAAAKRAREILAAKQRRAAEDALIAQANAALPQE